MLDVVVDMPGTVIEILVAEGEVVVAGQELLIVESMKMEVPIAAPRAGTIQAVLVAEGQAIPDQTAVIRLRPD